LGHPKCFATSPINSSFAYPSTGGDLSWASHVPSSFCSSRLARELGLTLIWMILGDIVNNLEFIVTFLIIGSAFGLGFTLASDER
jgi:hypothetical protein